MVQQIILTDNLLQLIIFASSSRSTHHEFLLTALLLLETHPLLVFLEIFSFRCLKVEPGVGKGLDVRQESFYEGVKLVLEY